MVKIHHYREGKLVVEEDKEEEYSENKLDIIYSETFKTFYATIEELTTEPRWIPKKVVSKELRIKKWYIKALKEWRLEKGKKRRSLNKQNYHVFLQYSSEKKREIID